MFVFIKICKFTTEVVRLYNAVYKKRCYNVHVSYIHNRKSKTGR